MSISKENVTSYFTVGDLIEDEKSANSIRITAINDDHVLIQVAFSDENEIRSHTMSCLARVNALNAASNESSQPLDLLAEAYQDRHDEAIDAMWKRAGACQLP